MGFPICVDKGVWRYLKLADVEPKPFYVLKEMDRKLQIIKDFCRLPISELAGYPLGLFDKLNKGVSVIGEWGCENNPYTLCRYWFVRYPYIFWASSMIWIPTTILYYILGSILFMGLCFGSIIFLLGLTISFCVICKVLNIFLFFMT